MQPAFAAVSYSAASSNSGTGSFSVSSMVTGLADLAGLAGAALAAVFAGPNTRRRKPLVGLPWNCVFSV